jgi:hypothetical protein
MDFDKLYETLTGERQSSPALQAERPRSAKAAEVIFLRSPANRRPYDLRENPSSGKRN